jgi:quercetin dioxygenase-like cupin family protein
MGVLHIRAGELPWGEPAGAWSGKFAEWSWKSLREDPDGVSISLWKLAPGGSDERHAHEDAEEHIYVLRGEFECDGVTYKAGDYLFRPAGVPHQTSSRTGVETLLVFVKRKDIA